MFLGQRNNSRNICSLYIFFQNSNNRSLSTSESPNLPSHSSANHRQRNSNSELSTPNTNRVKESRKSTVCNPAEKSGSKQLCLNLIINNIYFKVRKYETPQKCQSLIASKLRICVIYVKSILNILFFSPRVSRGRNSSLVDLNRGS